MNEHEIEKLLKKYYEKEAEEFNIPSTESLISLQDEKQVRKLSKREWIKWASVAACFMFFISAVFGVSGFIAEAKEYKNAVEFFDEFKLTTEGLSRDDIKAVYKDITTKSFNYSKTVDVLERSIKKDVDGFEIFQSPPTPEELEDFWNYRNTNSLIVDGWIYDGDYESRYKNGVWYDYNFEYMKKENGETDYNNLDKSVFKKHYGKTVVWEAVTKNYIIDGYQIIGNSIITYGNNSHASTDNQETWISMIDGNGNIQYEIRLEHIKEFNFERIRSIIDNKDGTFAIISIGITFESNVKDNNFLCIRQCDLNGNVLHFKKTGIGNSSILSSAKFEDGYIIQLLGFTTDENAKIVKIDYEGNITYTFTFESDDCRYFFTDMAEFNGYVYISGYSVPKLQDEIVEYRLDIYNILKYIYDNNISQISNEDLTQIMKKQFTAVLLVCEPSSGVPKLFYSAKGSLGAGLDIDESGNLIWNVESFVSTYYSPATSSFTIGGTCRVYRYTFDQNGVLIKQEKTDEITNFRR